MCLSVCVSVDLQFVSTIKLLKELTDWIGLWYTFLVSRNEGQVRQPAIFDRRFRFHPSKTVFYKIKKSISRPNYARYEKILKSQIVHIKEIYNFDFDHFLIKRTVFVLIMKNVIKNQKFNFHMSQLCDIRNQNGNVKWKLITLLISNQKEFNHFFKSTSSDIVLQKLTNLHQNFKCCEARNTEREAR